MASVVGFAALAELTPVEAQDLTVPSGQPVEFFETVMDQPAMGLTARFRFLAPELPRYLKDLSYEELEADLSALCVGYALPRLSTPEPAMIVISLSEAPTEFGSPDPDVAQVFEAYRPVDGVCEWEAF
ncbi:MAG: acetolactate synthase [Rhodobacteraceae bacterium]|nr:acetolactate synthase [Paracoccaceae bacterium]